MDARLDPAKALGLSEGDAHVIRNAGGRAADATRSVIISQQLLGTREIVVVHHVSYFTYYNYYFACGRLTPRFAGANSSFPPTRLYLFPMASLYIV